MKGIVFTEFMEHVESVHGYPALDAIIDNSGAETAGAYTSIGTYPCSELVSLITSLSQYSGVQMPDIITQFGESLAASFKRIYPEYFEGVDYFDFVEGIENRIHVDVLKLYPDAELPHFQTISRTQNELVIDYRSSRALEHLALGLLRGCAGHFYEAVAIEMSPFETETQSFVRFVIRRGVM